VGCSPSSMHSRYARETRSCPISGPLQPR
jgi:hypothetical protein